MGRHCVPGSIKATFPVCGGRRSWRFFRHLLIKTVPNFALKRERMRALVADLQERRAEAALGGSEERARAACESRQTVAPRSGA